MVDRVRRLRPDEDLHRHVRQRVPRVPLHRGRVDRRDEQQRRRLADRARHGEHGAGDDPAQRARQDDAEHRPPAARPERQRAFALAARHQTEHLLRGARDQREHHDREAIRAREPVLLVSVDEQAEDEDRDHDRGQAVHQVDHDLDSGTELRRGELVREDRDQHADRHGDQGGDADQDRGADDQRRDPAARLAEERQVLGQEADRKLRGAPLRDRPDDDPEHRHGDERGEQREQLGQPVHQPSPPGSAAAAPEIDRRLQRGHQSPPVRSTLRRTTSWARKFVTSPITSRIAPR